MHSDEATAQQSLLGPPPAWHARLDLRWDSSTGVGHLATSIRLARTGELVATRVHPFTSAPTLADAIAQAHEHLETTVRAVADPDPF